MLTHNGGHNYNREDGKWHKSFNRDDKIIVIEVINGPKVNKKFQFSKSQQYSMNIIYQKLPKSQTLSDVNR